MLKQDPSAGCIRSLLAASQHTDLTAGDGMPSQSTQPTQEMDQSSGGGVLPQPLLSSTDFPSYSMDVSQLSQKMDLPSELPSETVNVPSHCPSFLET